MERNLIPVWIAPVQVKVFPVSDKYNDYVKKVVGALEENDIRVEVRNLDIRSVKYAWIRCHIQL